MVWPFFRDHPDEPVPEENFWTLWCKGRLAEADTPTIQLGSTPSRLSSIPHFFDADRSRYEQQQPEVAGHQRWKGMCSK